MKKRLLFILMAVAAAAIFLWPRIFGFPSGPAPVVRLELGPTGSDSITPGIALTFDIYLEGQKGSSLGSFAKPWQRFVTLRHADGTVFSWRFIAGLDPYGIFSAPDGKTINFERRVSSSAYFDGSPGYYRVQLLLSPEESKNIPAGDYTLVASVEAARFPFSALQTIAQSAALQIKIATANGHESDQELIANNAEFYIYTRQFSRALAASEELASRQPQQARPHILQGDALAGLGRKNEALDAYLQARRLLPRTYEEPLLLNKRIRSAQQGW